MNYYSSSVNTKLRHHYKEDKISNIQDIFLENNTKEARQKNNKPAEKHFNKPKNVPDTEPYCVFCTRASTSVYRCCLKPAALVFD